MKIYLASSWKISNAVLLIKDCLIRQGFQVDAFCDQSHGRIGWNLADELRKGGGDPQDIDPISALQHPLLKDLFKRAFAEDKKWLDWCDCCIMIHPCGNSAHLEGGYATGRGKLFYIYWCNEPPKGAFDNMYQFADGLYRPNELEQLIQELKRQERLRASTYDPSGALAGYENYEGSAG